MLDWIVDVVLGPLQLLGFEVLRRPLEFTLAAVVCVMDDVLGAALGQRHLQSIQHQFRAQVQGHGPADDPSRPGVQDHGQKQEAGVGGDEGDVAHPQLVRAGGGEVAINQVGGRRGRRVFGGGLEPPTPRNTLDTCLLHEPGDTLLAHTDALLAQVMQDTGSAVGLVGGLVSGLDLAQEPLVGEFSIRRWTVQPRVVPAGGDAQQTAHGGHGIGDLVIAHEPEERGGICSVSRANQAAAFDRISRSILSWRFSRLRRISSSFSAVVRPSERSPWSRSA